ncbi:uncharacterized protein EKO05_0001196 [Ascochyta rabiei]|uniref:uncharacterized protein n=1 Tax=Didymella rabiei TaxID=5454 RepID=UPI00220849F9|nr:uncharacterized protein EKO05_0001196 [Ascochyta rabiei]UPX10544.1 hypothetical protein EKO05_0001196 [Ascochyta rabiei]
MRNARMVYLGWRPEEEQYQFWRDESWTVMFMASFLDHGIKVVDLRWMMSMKGFARIWIWRLEHTCGLLWSSVAGLPIVSNCGSAGALTSMSTLSARVSYCAHLTGASICPSSPWTETCLITTCHIDRVCLSFLR